MGTVGSVAYALILLASTALAGELSDAAREGKLEEVRKLLDAGTPVDDGKKEATPLLEALANGHAGVAELIGSRGGTVGANALYLIKPSCAGAARYVVRNGGRAMVVPCATMLWQLGPNVARQAMRWMGKDSTEHERKAALLAMRRIARGQPEVLAELAKRDDAFDALGWAGTVTPAVVRGLARGIALGNKEALIACTRLAWPKKRDADTKAAIKVLTAALKEARKQSELAPLADRARRALLGRQFMDVVGHPAGRAARRAFAKKKWLLIDEKAVQRGLKWLVNIQKLDEFGNWDADEHGGGAIYDAGLTALAALALMGSGHSPGGESGYSKNVGKALEYLILSQNADGVFGTRSTQKFMYCHGFATMAMIEGYALSGHPGYRQAAQRALEFIATAQNPGRGWRYEPRSGATDTNVTSLCLHALHLGRVTGLSVDIKYSDAAKWLDQVTDPDSGRVGYIEKGDSGARPEGKQDRFPHQHSEAMTAASVHARILFDKDARRVMHRGISRIVDVPPVWNPDSGSIDFYYWYWAALALHQHGGTEWRDWRKALKEQLAANQKEDGSWDPIGPWAQSDGGRIYSTALAVLTLESPYRYARAKGVR